MLVIVKTIFINKIFDISYLDKFTRQFDKTFLLLEKICEPDVLIPEKSTILTNLKIPSEEQLQLSIQSELLYLKQWPLKIKKCIELNLYKTPE